MSKDLIYTIYSHSDADGGIAAALFQKFIHDKYAKYGWKIEVQPVNHVSAQGDWSLRELKWPCAILDFSLHPAFLNNKFFLAKQIYEKKFENEAQIPQCYWIDHHPTGSSFPFLNENNTAEIIPSSVVTKWDTKAISTPGLLRTHHHELSFPLKFLKEYEEFIDLAEIIDGALYATGEAAHDYSSHAVKLQTLFTPSHPIVDKAALYKKLVKQIVKSSDVEDLFDSDNIFDAIIKYEEQLFYKQYRIYKKATQKVGKVAYSNFLNSREFYGMARFLPYLLFEDAEYALHVFPNSNKGSTSLSCGVNPWNKPKGNNKHLGNYFAHHFSGGGHAFVAGGRLLDGEVYKLDKLIEHLNE